VHRPQNTDNPKRLKSIFSAFAELDKPVVLPLHPRTEKYIKEYSITTNNVILIEPVSYLYMLRLLINADRVLTDSGGLQKEAYFVHKQCVTLRDETEWKETLHDNWNIIAGGNKEKILASISSKLLSELQEEAFGTGNAANIIIETLLKQEIEL